VVTDSTNYFNDIVEIISIDPPLALGLLKKFQQRVLWFPCRNLYSFSRTGSLGNKTTDTVVFGYNGS
jgi:hypothetical protein